MHDSGLAGAWIFWVSRLPAQDQHQLYRWADRSGSDKPVGAALPRNLAKFLAVFKTFAPAVKQAILQRWIVPAGLWPRRFGNRVPLRIRVPGFTASVG